MPPRHRTITALCCAAGLAALGPAPGCGGKRARPQVAPEEDPISPVVRGAEAGLEARLWVVENGGGALPRAFRGFPPPAGAEPAVIELWRRNGFRVLGVPLDRLETLRHQVPTIGPLHQQWLGLLPEWVEVVKGARLGPAQRVALDNGPVELGPGRLRLLSRCWAAPSVGAQPDGSPAGAVLRLEVMPELEMDAPSDPLERLLAGAPEGPDAAPDGIAFDRLLLSLSPGDATAVVIVPEDPALDWAAAGQARPESIGDARAQGPEFGPQAPTTPTLGELMLTSLALPESASDARIVVVLVPRVPDRFELLPR
ncbi:MAG TPA: hypothetical protein VFF69_00100 [Phycisphaerales bacterium]|nr:hypothetical protein [Phycisphaerales bacterium]